MMKSREPTKSSATFGTSGKTKHAAHTYESERILGSGSFGVVFKARVAETGEVVAIKKVFQDERYKNRELDIMKELRHPNVVDLKTAFYTKEEKKGEEGTYLNVVMGYCSDTVWQVLKHYNKQKQQVPNVLVMLFSYQLCRACAYIHALGIAHRDIKPQNLLVDGQTTSLKLCDFGSAKRFVKGEPNVAYICSRYYRAPELILGATEYTTAVDLWSSACVTAELILGQPLFLGQSNVDQLVEIVKILGTPSQDELIAMSPHYTDFKFPQISSHPWNKVFRHRSAPQAATEFISSVLQYDPAKRPSGLQAAAHPFFDGLRSPNCRISADREMPDCFDFTVEELSVMDANLEKKLIPEWAARTNVQLSRRSP
jgi:glycogen synthase kinase 3 beta